MAKRSIIAALLSASLLFASPLYAENLSVASLRADLNAFKKSEDARFAPKTVERVDAYLGAAMLAGERNRTEDMQDALNQAEATLTEAQQTAAGFRDKYADLILLSDDTKAIVEAVSLSMQTPPAGTDSPQQLIRDADKMLSKMIISREKGDLNQTQNLAGKARGKYIEARNSSIPWLADLSDMELSKAGRAGAKNYAPLLYQTAKEKQGQLLAYIQGVSTTPPDRPVEALYLAREAKHMAEQVRLWRRHTGSHEELALTGRQFRRQLAAVLDVHADPNPLLADVPGKPLLEKVVKLKHELKRERRERDEERLQLKQQYEAELQARLKAQADELATAQHTQLRDIKDAFRAKLEKETYEQKRQDSLKKLFAQDEAQVFINIDGSLLVRLTKLQFASGHSKVDPVYFGLLGNLKKALEIYSDRNVRIEGHTDNTGDVKPNQLLSLKRAEAVRDFLISAGTDGTRMKALGYGEVRPIASNEFPQGRAMNRRIDVIIDAAQK